MLRRIFEKRDVIERPISDKLDISGWDLRKALSLYRKSNPPLLEWLQFHIEWVRYSNFSNYLLHIVSVLCLFLSMFGDERLDTSEEMLDKYIRSLNVIDAPFYIRSLFARNFLSIKEAYRSA